MKIYNSTNVLESSLNRIRYIFDEFDEVIVSFSSGKDSVTMFHLAMQVAKEKNRLPLGVFFLDQELEWESTIDLVKKVMYDPNVKPYWLQVPFRLFNATSGIKKWLNVWGEGEEWAREKDPIAIHENTFGQDRFQKMFDGFINTTFPNKSACTISGVRAEESPTRMLALTHGKTYKWITWGNQVDTKKKQYTFYPIYDWSYTDVWKYIHDNGFEYNKLYDKMYQMGVPVQNMRVSNYHHETAISALFVLQEIEPETYNKATKRLSGIDTAGKLGRDDYFVDKLPFMFKDWREYRDYLLENLIIDQPTKQLFIKEWAKFDKNYLPYLEDKDSLYKVQVNGVLANDSEFTKLHNWERTKFAVAADKSRKGLKWG